MVNGNDMAYEGGLRKWHKEKWVDVKTGKECGRKSASDSSRPYPACRPAKTAKKSGMKKDARKKTGPDRISWSRSPSGKKKGS